MQALAGLIPASGRRIDASAVHVHFLERRALQRFIPASSASSILPRKSNQSAHYARPGRDWR
jgi:hypothetical protein